MAEEEVRREEEEEVSREEEDTGAVVAPVVKLEAIAVTTGEENEDVLLDLKCKLYRFDKSGNQWKERGAGSVKLLSHKETKKVRLIVRQSKTLKICANHLVLPTISLQEHAGNEKSCVWHALDFSEGELKEELFCIRFASIENAKTFKETIKSVAESQAGTVTPEDEAAAALQALKVQDEEDKSGDAPKAVSEKTDEKEVKSTEKEEAVAKEVEAPTETKKKEATSSQSGAAAEEKKEAGGTDAPQKDT